LSASDVTRKQKGDEMEDKKCKKKVLVALLYVTRNSRNETMLLIAMHSDQRAVLE
jgi:hypothetical protein